MVQVNTYPRLFYPCAEYAARGHGYVPAPQLGMDTAGNAALSVEGYAVLHGAQIAQTQSRLLGALPVLLEPASGVAVHGQADGAQGREPPRRGFAHAGKQEGGLGPTTLSETRKTFALRPERIE